ncbi:MAG: type II toxin-antitoxin system RelE/ParE family toxin [Planctomycetes bacterium]|nr:type II toxin-antitoxin system RelE/ParE family toxin [Planctomycetota bacterium]MBL7038403.1 type II toxin-antitoxin system RelE/ParE family toxin [Pirellulaceae bacterium]
MPCALWTPTAETELEEIVFFIAVEGGRPVTAERIAREIHDRATSYANNPELGHRHPDFPANWRYFLHKRWLILYQPHEQGIEVLRVVDATRDLPHVIDT